MKPGDLFRYVLALGLLSVPIFYNLGDLPIRVWDESRLAMNAWEMFSNKQFLVVHFNGEPEMWSTKPQLMIWFQAICIYLFGLSEFSIRFPSALSALLTCLVLIVISHRYLKRFWLGVMAAFILITIDRYSGHHVARTGDYDALLILFLTMSSFALFFFVERFNSKYLLLSILFFSLAIATKGVAALLIVPGLVFYAAFKKHFIPVLQDRYFWLGLLLLLLIVLVVYGGREYFNPGYLKAVYQNEIGGRYFEANEGHIGGPFFYLKVLSQEHWICFLPVLLITFLFKRGNEYSRISQFSLIVAVLFLLFVSIARTKLYWYVAPVYPFIALMLAIGFINCYDLLKQRIPISRTVRMTLSLIVVIALFVKPVYTTFNKIWSPEVYEYEQWQYEMSYHLRDTPNANEQLSHVQFMRKQYQPHIDFYVLVLQQRGVDISFGHSDRLNTGDMVIYWEDPIEELLMTISEVEFLEDSDLTDQVRIVRIQSMK